MKKQVLALVALALAATLGADAMGGQSSYYGYNVTNYANDPYAAQIAYDSFNYSVRKRFDSVRAGETVRGGVASAPLVRSQSAYGMAPDTRDGGVYSRRQLDCVYYNGFTIWGDLAAVWAGQSSDGDRNGYRFDGVAPVLGFDWSNNAFTVGIATTYMWGKLKGQDWVAHDQNTYTWGIEGYAQYNANRWYANATLGYGNTSYRGDRQDWSASNASFWYPYDRGAEYHTNSWNIDGEFGMKFDFKCFRVTPHIGLRYFHDRRGDINESWWGDFNGVSVGRQNYYTMELPIGVNLAYEFVVGGAVLIPQLRFAWVPELYRKAGEANGFWNNGDWFHEEAPTRSHQGFILGAGLEAKITKSISAHLDYNCNLRPRAYEHHLNLGVGFTF